MLEDKVEGHVNCVIYRPNCRGSRRGSVMDLRWDNTDNTQRTSLVQMSGRQVCSYLDL